MADSTAKVGLRRRVRIAPELGHTTDPGLVRAIVSARASIEALEVPDVEAFRHY